MKKYLFYIQRMLLFFLLLCYTFLNAEGQAYYRVTDSTGTHAIGGRNVSLHDTGQILPAQYICDSVGPYDMLSGAYAFSFSSPVKAISMHIIAINVGDTIDIYINGVRYYVSSSNISCFASSCSGQSNTVTTYNGELCGTICNSNADIQFFVNPGYPVNSFEIKERTAYCGGINYDFYFSPYCPGVAFATPCNMKGNICRGDTLSLYGSGTGLSGYATYSWTGPNGFTSGLQDPVILHASTAASGIYTLSINDTGSCAYTATVSVNVDSPAVAVIPSANNICAGDSVVLYVTGANTYTWMPAAGLSCSSCSQPTASPASTTTYTVTGTDGQGCTSTATSVISVIPVPNVNSMPNLNYCNGASTAIIGFTGTVGGTVYSWTNSNTLTGLSASSGSGSIGSFTATNPGTAAITGTITVTPHYTSNGFTCTGTASSFTIGVNPSPGVYSISNQTLCNGGSTAAINFSGPAVSGTVYNWTNNNTAIGLAASGTGNIASFIASNSGNVPVTVTITVIPSANGCNGTAQTFTITVNPTPNVNAISDQTVCNTLSTATVSMSGNVSGTVYNWTNNNTSIGLAGNGNGNIASFTAYNSSSLPVVAIIAVTPNANGCNGTVMNFTITVLSNYLSCSPCSLFNNHFTAIAGSSITSWPTSSTGNYYVADSVTIKNSMTISNAIIMVRANAAIMIDSGAHVIFSNCHLFGCSNDMWNGLRVNTINNISGSLFLTNNTLIEDADTAVLLRKAVPPTSGNIFAADNAIFNRNTIGVYIDSYRYDTSIYPFTVRNTVFTCRDIDTSNSNWANAATLKQYYNPGSNFLAPYNIVNYHGDTTHSGGIAVAGILLKNVGHSVVTTPFLGDTTLTLYGIQLGDASQAGYQNLFDTLQYGIHSLQSNMTLLNNAFVNESRDGIYGNGIAAYAEGYNGLWMHNDGSSNNNQFWNCDSSCVELHHYYWLKAWQTKMISSHDYSLANGPANWGYNLQTNAYDTIDVSYDTVTNITNGISLVSFTQLSILGGMGYSALPFAYVNISGNVIKANPFGNVTTQFVRQAISLQNTTNGYPLMWVNYFWQYQYQQQ